MNNMKYLVTGGAGFIGSHLVEKIINFGNEVIIIDDLSSGYKENIPYRPKNKLMIEKVQNVPLDYIDNIDGIFHLAAQASAPYSIEQFYESSKNNILSSFKVFEWAKEKNVPVVYASSSAIYGNLPLGDESIKKYDIISPYAQDKLTTEHYAKMMFDLYNVNSFGLRFFNVYGPKQDPTNPYSGVISIFIDKILKEEPVTINGGYQTRDFIYIGDIVNVLVKSMAFLHQNQLCEIFNVGTSESISIDQLFGIISETTNTSPKIVRKKLPIGDPEISSGTFNKIKSILNINIQSFIDINAGLIKTIEYYKQHN